MKEGIRVNFGGNVMVPVSLCNGDEDKAQELIKGVLKAVLGFYDGFWEEDSDEESQCMVWVSE